MNKKFIKKKSPGPMATQERDEWLTVREIGAKLDLAHTTVHREMISGLNRIAGALFLEFNDRHPNQEELVNIVDNIEFLNVVSEVLSRTPQIHK